MALALGSAGVGDKAEVVVNRTLRQDLKGVGVCRQLIFSNRDLDIVGVDDVGVLASVVPRFKVFRLITGASYMMNQTVEVLMFNETLNLGREGGNKRRKS